jgi:DhnA family fructose-bisphosphate aldolase class Ia
MGRIVFQLPMDDGVKLLNTIQDVYADKTIDDCVESEP